MKSKFVASIILVLTLFVTLPVHAGSVEKEISLNDLNDSSLNLQNLNPLRMPGKTYDDKASQTVITGYAAVSFRANDNGVTTRSGNEMPFGLDPAATSDFGFSVMEIGFTKRYSDLFWIGAAFEIKQENEDGTIKTETELSAGEIHLVAPIGNGLDFTVGKFNSPVSFEKEDAPLLLQASHSLAYQLASPSKMVGLMMTYPFNENLDVKGAVFNGWNQDGDNNNAKSLFFQIGYAPSTNLDMHLSLIWGPEENNNENDFRSTLDWVATWLPVRNWIIGVELAYGNDEQGSIRNPGTDADWYSGQVTMHHDFIKWFGTTLRYSFFDDREGRPDIQNRQRRTLNEVTLSPVFHLSPEFLGFMGLSTVPKTRHFLSGIDLRFEYRYDWVNEANATGFFQSASGTNKSERNMFNIELVANF